MLVKPPRERLPYYVHPYARLFWRWETFTTPGFSGFAFTKAKAKAAAIRALGGHPEATSILE
jgi:hypothetical protein